MKKRIIRFLIFILLLGAAGGYLYYDYSGRVYTKAIVEAGTVVTAKDFQKRSDASVKILSVNGTENGVIPSDTPGDYNLVLSSGFFRYNAVLTVQDTTAPELVLQDLSLSGGENVSPEDFVVSMTDATALSIRYGKEPDMTYYGPQEITIIAEDLGGNQTESTASLSINPVVSVLELEAGSQAPKAQDFLLPGLSSSAISYAAGESDIDPAHVGDYPVKVKVDGVSYDSLVSVSDHTAPTLEVQDVTEYTTGDLSVERFVVSTEDATDVTLSFKEEPDFSKEGTVNVSICAVDEGGNETVKSATATLSLDTTPPVISGLRNRTLYTGESLSYRNGVTVTDNCDKNVALNIDTSKVSLTVPGDYEVVYTATDKAGNTTSKTVTISVRVRNYDEATVNELADRVLAGIITADMSDRDKLTAIWNWVRHNVHYANHSDKTNYNQGAFEGLYDRKGDCFVYAATSDALLRRAGIKTMVIAKIPAATSHFWNLVDIGEGWHHFDTCPRRDKNFACVYEGNTWLINYSNSHNKSHNYDPAQYPEIAD